MVLSAAFNSPINILRCSVSAVINSQHPHLAHTAGNPDLGVGSREMACAAAYGTRYSVRYLVR